MLPTFLIIEPTKPKFIHNPFFGIIWGMVARRCFPRTAQADRRLKTVGPPRLRPLTPVPNNGHVANVFDY